MAEDVRNVFTTIIELRTSCQMVWSSIAKVENKRIQDQMDKARGDNGQENGGFGSLSFVRMADGRQTKVTWA